MKPCLYHRCLNYVPKGVSYCAEHKPASSPTTKMSGLYAYRKARQRMIRQAGPNPTCGICGKPIHGPIDVDHVKPVSKGGTNDPTNLRLSHPTCNRSTTRPGGRR